MKVSLETVKLTASFKLNGLVPETLFSAFREILTDLLGHASAKGITSFKRLRAEKYCERGGKYPALPSHYILHGVPDGLLGLQEL